MVTPDPNTFTHTPTKNWALFAPEERVEKVQAYLDKNKVYADIKVTMADKNGHVVVLIDHSIPANERGLFLLEMEQQLKKNIDVGITIWLEPVGDKSKLRQLRGVEVKT